MSEHWSGPYTQQFARRGTGDDATYWQKLVDATDRSTWMEREKDRSDNAEQGRAP